MNIFKRWLRKPSETGNSKGSVPAQVQIASVTFSDGKILPMAAGAILVLTGPNNVGKSSALREIRDFLIDGVSPKPVISSITTRLQGEKDDFKEQILKGGLRNTIGDVVRIHSRDYRLDFVERDYERGFVGAAPMNLFLSYLGASERLALTAPTRRGDYLRDAPREPLQWLEFDGAAEDKISAFFKKTFGRGLILNTLAGENLALHIADQPAESEQKTARDYAAWLSEKPRLERQGDGMRSFAGTVLSLLVHPRNIVLLDEPEAFLHPPQSRTLAQFIAVESSVDSQIIVATHSDEILRAMLDTAGDRITVARIVRDGESNRVSILQSDQIVQLWTDPTLRTSDVLSALFHDVAIICEGDSDCRFFRNLLDATRGEEREADSRFYQFGGKDKIANVASALKALDVPVIAIVDIDIVSDRAKILKLYETLGGSEEKISGHLKTIIASVEARKSQITGAELALELRRVADEVQHQSLIQKPVKEHLSSIARASSSWTRLKEDGYRGLVDAASINAYKSLERDCKEVGLLINPEGELEGFCREISRARKSEWLSEVLRLDFVNNSALEAARRFAADIRGTVAAALTKQVPGET